MEVVVLKTVGAVVQTLSNIVFQLRGTLDAVKVNKTQCELAVKRLDRVVPAVKAAEKARLLTTDKVAALHEILSCAEDVAKLVKEFSHLNDKFTTKFCSTIGWKDRFLQIECRLDRAVADLGVLAQLQALSALEDMAEARKRDAETLNKVLHELVEHRKETAEQYKQLHAALNGLGVEAKLNRALKENEDPGLSDGQRGKIRVAIGKWYLLLGEPEFSCMWWKRSLEVRSAYAAEGNCLLGKLYFNATQGAEYFSSDVALPVAYWTQARDLGDAEASYWLGMCSAYGWCDSPVDLERATALFRECVHGGVCAVQQDAEQELHRAARKAELDDLAANEAQLSLVIAEMRRKCVDLHGRYMKLMSTDPAVAEAWNQRVRQNALVQLMLNGDDDLTIQDKSEALLRHGLTLMGQSKPSQAIAYLRSAAKDGNTEAMYQLGMMYWDGNGVETDCNEAFVLFTHAAEAGYAGGCAGLGLLMLEGRGGTTKEPVKAVKLLEKATENQHAGGPFGLGYAYYGGLGVQQDRNRAARLFLQSAEQGNVYATYWLASRHYHGQGVRCNRYRAAQLYHIAAEAGHAWAMYILGQMYRDGNGVARDKYKARNWVERAAAAKLQNAIDALPNFY